MNESGTPSYEPENIGMGLGKRFIFSRILVMVLIVYLTALMIFARSYIIGDLFNGFGWPYPGFTLFPVPIVGGSAMPVVEPLSPLDFLVYIVFIGHEFWVLWVFLGLLYIFKPLSSRLQSLTKSTKHE
ncbi:MAG: hypothetical protein RTU92_01375 [Candidatus Thorarchaeota archaeon]